MGFTLKSSYALRGIYIIARKMREENKEAISIGNIVKGTDIPKDFLEKIFGELRHTKIIKSLRGRYGGYALAKDPKDIKIRDIIFALDNPMGSFKCMGEHNQCAYSSTCAVKYVWDKLQEAMFRELSDMTVEDLFHISTEDVCTPELNFESQG